MQTDENGQSLVGFFPTDVMANGAVEALKKANLVSGDDSVKIDKYSGSKSMLNLTEDGRVFYNDYLLRGEAFIVSAVIPQHSCKQAVDIMKANGGRFSI